jgi:diacylglycerol kinase family enzyme
MYLYIYDSFLNHKKYTDLLTKIEKRITDLGIKGKVAKLSVLKNMKELILDGVREGVQTVLVIGNSQSFTKVINIVANLDVTLALIPVENGSSIAKTLGIAPGVLACDVLASRIIKKIDLGKINTHYFISNAQITDGDIIIEYDQFKIQPTTSQNKIVFYNLASPDSNINSKPDDGLLEAVITPMKSTLFGKKAIPETILPFKKIRITSNTEEQVSIITDEQIIMKNPAEISVSPAKLKIIVGSDRQFE